MLFLRPWLFDEFVMLNTEAFLQDHAHIDSDTGQKLIETITTNNE